MPEKSGKAPPLLYFLLILLTLIGANSILTLITGELTESLGKNGGADVSYSPSHFVMPAMPPGLLKLLGSVANDFNMASAAFVVLLLVFYLVLMLNVAGQVAEWKEIPQSPATLPSAGLKNKTRMIVAFVIALVLFTAFAVKVSYTEPLLKPGEGPGKTALLKNFYVNFNSAIAAKVRYREDDYRDRMFKALKISRADYLWFSHSWYWAVWESGKTTRTERYKYAADNLYDLFKQGLLRDEDIREGIAMNRKKGDSKKADEMMEYLKENRGER